MIAPANNNESEAISVLPLVSDVIEIVNKTIIEIPDDSPSNPSIKFMAFVIPTIQITVINPAMIDTQSPGKKSNPFK